MNKEDLKAAYLDWMKEKGLLIAESTLPGTPSWEDFVLEIVSPTIKNESYFEGYADGLEAGYVSPTDNSYS